MKVCPILAAGNRDLVWVEESGNRVHIGPKCIKDYCEWYGAGCPAHPNQLATNVVEDEDNEARD